MKRIQSNFVLVALFVQWSCVTSLLPAISRWGHGNSPSWRLSTVTRPSTPTFTTAVTATDSSTTTTSSSESSPSPSISKKETLSLFSPCKINLFLRILRKRPDGFHDLASLFQAIGFGDTLELTPLDDDDEQNKNTNTITSDEFTCNMEGVPTDSRNLVIRALELMRQKTGKQVYFKANLIKQVPAQAGLGGGSANAATAMWGANELMGRPATLEQMVKWSADLGSDITFFLSHGTAYCTGRGEILSPIDPPLPSGQKVCIVKPDIGLSTPSVFKALNYNELSQLDAEETLLPSFLKARDKNNNVEQVPAEYFINDLEPPAFRCVPELKTLKEELQLVDGFTHVMMSGSGTSIFCLGEPKDKDAFLKQFAEKKRGDTGVKVFFSEFISRPEGMWFEKPSVVRYSSKS